MSKTLKCLHGVHNLDFRTRISSGQGHYITIQYIIIINVHSMAGKTHLLTFLGENSVSVFLAIHGSNLVVETSALECKFLTLMRLFCPNRFAIGQVEAQQ